MQAELSVERIERRLSLDEVSDADWLRTETETTEDGQLLIVKSCRLSNGDVAKYGHEQVQAWIDEDQRRYQRLGDEWWLLNAQAVAVVAVMAGTERLGAIEISSGSVGGIESDAPREYYDELSGELVSELKEQLLEQGLSIPDDVAMIYVCSDPCLVPALGERRG